MNVRLPGIDVCYNQRNNVAGKVIKRYDNRTYG